MQSPLPPPTLTEPPTPSVPLAMRDTALDAVRGVAILGILLANVSVMLGPGIMETLPTVSSGDEWLVAAHSFLVSGKFRGMLSLLFGAGMAMQFRRLQLPPNEWYGKYARRMGVLFGIGLLHAVLIWPGDVLTYYAIAGIASMWCVRQSYSLRIGLATALATMSLMIGALVSLIPADDPTVDSLVLAERLAYTTGGFGDQILWRLSFFPLSLISAVVMVGAPMAMFLLGSVLYDSGIVSGQPNREGVNIRSGLLIAFAGGVFLSLGLAVLMGSKLWPGAGLLIDLGVSLFIAPGLTILLLEGFRRFTALNNPFIGVGRYALTIYVTQSILGTGFALGTRSWGEWSLRQELMIAGILMVISIALGWALNRLGVRGPLESLFRSAGRMR